MELTPKEAITVIRNLQDWLYLSGINGGTRIQREALQKNPLNGAMDVRNMTKRSTVATDIPKSSVRHLKK